MRDVVRPVCVRKERGGSGEGVGVGSVEEPITQFVTSHRPVVTSELVRVSHFYVTRGGQVHRGWSK